MADKKVIVVRSNGQEVVLRELPKTASQVFDKNSLVEFSTGVIDPADDNDTAVVGVILEDVLATDEDYAQSGAKRLVQMLRPGDEVEIDYTGSDPVPGTWYGISNAYTVDTSDTTNKVFQALQVLPGSRVRGVFKTALGGFES